MSTVDIEEETSSWHMPNTNYVTNVESVTFETVIVVMFVISVVLFLYSLKRQT
jgi:hypothetical protein